MAGGGPGAARQQSPDEAPDWEEASTGVDPLLPAAEEAPGSGGAAAGDRRRLQRVVGTALVAGTLLAAAALCVLRPFGVARAPSQQHLRSAQDGLGAELALKQQQYGGGATYASADASYGWGDPVPPGAAGAAPAAAAAGGGASAAATPSYVDGGGARVVAAPPGAHVVPGPLVPAAGGPSLYCFALTMAHGGEMKLLRYQLQMRVSLFSCNEYQIFSNETVAVGPDAAKGGAALVTIPIGISMEVPHGGRWGTALNTDVFVRLWAVVAQEGRWQFHEWSAKLDADAVFLPDRLRGLLRSMPTPGPTYLNNCKWGMHGPIEVVSRAGLQTYFSNVQSCEQIREDAMQWQPVHWNEKMQRWTGTDKDHSFGEDQYLRRCLRLLHVQVVNEYRLLDELACGGKPKQTGCIGNYVSYHPFKEVDQYKICLAYAQTESSQPAR